MKIHRAATVATALQVAKLLRANVKAIVEKDYLSKDIEDVIRSYKDFLLDLVALTPRITKPVLMEACDQAFETVSAAEAEMWAKQIISCITHCGGKTQSFANGVKLHSHTAALVKALKARRSPKKNRISPRKSPKGKIKKDSLIIFVLFCCFFVFFLHILFWSKNIFCL